MTPLPRQKASGSGVRFSPAAFTLIEMMLVLCIIGLISSVLIPILASPFARDRRLETIREMTAIVEAIYGRVDLGDPGYVSSMGGLPPQVLLNGQSVLDIAALYKQPAYAQDPASQTATLNMGAVPAGWNGPYLRSFSPDPVRDSWGQQYRYSFNGADSSQWRITSSGPDLHIGTSDDLVLPSATSWFTTAGTVEINMNLATRGRRVAPMPDDYLAPKVAGGGRSQIPVTVYLPIATSNARIPCVSGAPDARCTGVCEVVDADGNGAASLFATDSANHPYRIRCRGENGSTGLPYGVHHVSMTFPAGLVYGVSTRTYEANIVVNRPMSSTQLTVGADVETSVETPQWNTHLLTVSSSSATGEKIADYPVGGIAMLTAQTDLPLKPLVATLRFTGTMLLSDDTTQCAVELRKSGAALSSLPPKKTIQTWGPVTGEARVPFTYEYTLSIPAAASDFDLSQLDLRLTRESLTGSCTVASLTASTLRYVQR